MQRTARLLSSFNVALVLTLMLPVFALAQDQQNGNITAAISSGKPLTADKPVTLPIVPQVAPNYEAPAKPIPTFERVGVDAQEPLPLTLNEAIRLALANNNDIDAAQIDVEKGEFQLTAARGAYDPRVSSGFNFEHSRLPVASFLGGNGDGSLKQTEVTSRFGIDGLAPWAGGSYTFNFSSTRLKTNDFFNTLNPTHSAQFSFDYTQPLLRGRRTDDNRRRIEIAKKNLSLTDVQFRQRATEVITHVEQAYWELVYALRNLQVQIEAVNQTRAQVETNRRQVNQGTLAPIDVVEAEAQVKIFEQAVYAAQEDVTRAENGLKTLLLANRQDEMWARALLPITPVNLEAPRLPLSEAINTALSNRLELAELKTSADINDINRSYYRDQIKPQLDLTVGYSSNGVAGTATDFSDNPLLNGVSSLQQRVNDLSEAAGLPPLSTATLPPVSADLRGGYGRSLANLWGQDNPTVRVGVTISLPLKNRSAKANLGESLAEGRRLDTLKAKAEQMIEADVRNTMQAVRSVEARLNAAAASRTAAEQQYSSEQRKFQAGMSTVFLVLQRQTDLVTARGRELQTQTQLNKAIADLQRAMGNTFRYRNVAVSAEGQRLQLTNETSTQTSVTEDLPATTSTKEVTAASLQK